MEHLIESDESEDKKEVSTVWGDSGCLRWDEGMSVWEDNIYQRLLKP